MNKQFIVKNLLYYFDIIIFRRIYVYVHVCVCLRLRAYG